MASAYNRRVTAQRNPAWSSPVRSALDSPRYFVPEAARYLGIPQLTLKSWIGDASDSLVCRADENDPRLSFANLIEAHTLRALRTTHGVRMKFVRTALDYAAKECELPRVLLSDDLRATPGEVFLQRLGVLINIGRGGQEGMVEILGAFLQRIDRDIKGVPVRLFPFSRPMEQASTSPRLICIDPKIASGRPILFSGAIRTSTIEERFLAGESLAALAEEYGMALSEIEEAIRYEQQRPEAA
jgi:uncharacterized protein (DUF433 family)